MTFISLCAVAAITAVSSFVCHAQSNSPVGLWKSIDDHTGKPNATIRLSEHNGVLTGQVLNLFGGPGDDVNPLCGACDGIHKDQPIIGMVILSGMRREGETYGGGLILDPDNGKMYKSKIKAIDGGKKLEVRGYIGIPLLGRTQIWVRAD